MEKKTRQKVRYEMFSYEGTSAVPFQATTYNLVFENPSEITFFNYGGTSVLAIINNNIFLSPFILCSNRFNYSFMERWFKQHLLIK